MRSRLGERSGVNLADNEDLIICKSALALTYLTDLDKSSLLKVIDSHKSDDIITIQTG
jgi:hypothetical protein